MVSNDRYMTTFEASISLGYTIQHIRRLLRGGRLQGMKLGRDWVVSRESVAICLQNSNTEPLLPGSKRGRPRSGGRPLSVGGGLRGNNN